jgi:hypothetical protein
VFKLKFVLKILPCYTVGYEPEPNQNFHPEPHKNDAASLHCYKKLNLGLFRKFVSIFMIECTVEMPECRNTGKNVSPASLVLPLVRRLSTASAFRHRPQSGTADHGLIR